MPIYVTVSTTAAEAPMPGLPAAQLLNRSSHGWLVLCIPGFGSKRKRGREKTRRKGESAKREEERTIERKVAY